MISVLRVVRRVVICADTSAKLLGGGPVSGGHGGGACAGALGLAGGPPPVDAAACCGVASVFGMIVPRLEINFFTGGFASGDASLSDEYFLIKPLTVDESPEELLAAL